MKTATEVLNLVTAGLWCAMALAGAWIAIVVAWDGRALSKRIHNELYAAVLKKNLEKP